jgi:hypothetical protein
MTVKSCHGRTRMKDANDLTSIVRMSLSVWQTDTVNDRLSFKRVERVVVHRKKYGGCNE